MDLMERYCPACGAVCAGGNVACAACGSSLKVTRQLDAQKNALVLPSLRLAVHLQTLQLFNERYRITRQVGVGGFGAVYEAADTWEPRRVAIKEIGLAGLNAQQVIEATGSFNREVEMLSSLRHAGIPRMYEQLTDADHWYLVMQFIAGQTLETILTQADNGHLPLTWVLSIGLQICAVLEYLHSRQPAVIFRDLKPANIMLTPESSLYLIDFGVARRYQRSKTRDTIAFGSPGYAAPEQYGRAQTTPLSDIYSLGALLYCLLTGDDPSDHPFKFPPLRLYGVDGIRELDALIQRMVASDPAQRPQKVLAELRRIQQLHLQSLKRTPIWIPPQGRTPPNMLAPARSAPQQQQTASTPIWIPPQGRTPPNMLVAASSGPQQHQMVSLSSAPGQQPQQMVSVPSAPGSLQHQMQQPQQTVSVPSAPGPLQHQIMPVPAVPGKQPPARKTSRRRMLIGSLIASGTLLTIGLGAAWESHRNASTEITGSGSASATATAPNAEAPDSSNGQQPAVPANGATYWSTDLSYAAVANSTANQLEIYSVHPQKLLYTIPEIYYNTAILWSPDNRRFFFVPDNSVWNAQTGKKIYQLSSSLSQAFTTPGFVGWSPNGKYIVGSTSYFEWTNVAFLDAANGNPLFQTNVPGYNVANCLAWSPNSRYVVFPDTDNSSWLPGNPWSAEIMDTRTFQQVGTLGNLLPPRQNSLSPSSATGMAWSPDGTSIVMAIDDHAWICSLAHDTEGLHMTDTTLISIPLNGFPLWSPNGRYLAFYSYTTLNVYDTRAYQTALNVQQDSLGAVFWSADSKTIISANDNNILSSWKIESNQVDGLFARMKA